MVPQIKSSYNCNSECIKTESWSVKCAPATCNVLCWLSPTLANKTCDECTCPKRNTRDMKEIREKIKEMFEKLSQAMKSKKKD
ncbi:UNVERIFIED_CONTAM: hypothetical protein NCL1_46698 [Trichonephila clavipes]